MLQEMPKEANIIVVGAGLSGLELVSELLKCGIPNVVLLESGSYDRIAHTNSYLTPRESFTFWQSPELDPDFYQPWRSDSTPHYCGLSGLRRGIGGRSRYWRGITLRMDDWALEDPIWPVGIRHDLERSWKGNIGLYEEVEKDLACWARRDLSAFRGIEEKILVDFLSHTLDSPCLPVPLARQYSLTKTGKKWCAYTPISRWMEFGGNLE
ncbi:MAG: hypothetical protein QG609_604, partial [Patescibacteria group bacterium]|nr:hypothetical protein [Patescibacteria group bacterium]